MTDIARAAGVSKRSLYLWHVDKAALFRCCTVEGAQDIGLPRLDPETPPEIALLRFGDLVLPAISTDFSVRMARLLYRESCDFVEVRAALKEGTRLMWLPIVDYLLGRNVLPQMAERIARAFVAALTSDVHLAIVSGEAPPDAASSMEHARFVASMFAPLATRASAEDECLESSARR